MKFRKSLKVNPDFIPDLADSGTNTCVLLHSNNPQNKSILAVGLESELKVFDYPDFNKFEDFISDKNKWYFGILAYELGKVFEPDFLKNNQDLHDLPLLYFFSPKAIAIWQNGEVDIQANKEEDLKNLVEKFKSDAEYSVFTNSNLEFNLSEESYIQNFEKIQSHIQNGDTYEINYCLDLSCEFFGDPWQVWLRLNKRTRAPFAAYLNTPGQTLICGSPERFLSRQNNTITSQPIKGTRKRGRDASEDEILIKELMADLKERSENIMITDLVRNDLSKSAIPGSVRVEELCEIYSFETVHQMISTIKAEVSEDVSLSRILRDTFPMGSMTGAPKLRSMQIISEVERTARGWYSGACGYIKPGGDFDFNVIIRSLIFNKQKNQITAGVGGAITALSNPQNEWEECRLKAKALIDCLNDGGKI